MTEVLEPWMDFNVAMAGATGALAGLAIVAASVNIGDIVKDNSLTSRLASGVATLVLALIVSAVGLVPGLSLTGYGIVVLVATLIAGGFTASHRGGSSRTRTL
jgi:peptidoglycan/LPS O-acetylase OafA/YrhL